MSNTLLAAAALGRPATKNVLQRWFPTTTSPFIANAPMLGFANGALAAAVSAAGGLGFIGGGFDFSIESSQIDTLDNELQSARTILNHTTDEPLPIGIGFIMCHSSASSLATRLTSLLEKHKPTAIWFFAPDPDNPSLSTVIPEVRTVGASWSLKVFVQVGSVKAAREAVRDGADGIVAQGTDAGGHQWAKGVGIVSIVPEVRDMLSEEFTDKEMALWAAGGIVDGRGLAAALMLGADGIVMGTRFVVSEESPTPQEIKDAMVLTTDASSSTEKSVLFDDIQSTAIWPVLYDGRAIVGPSYEKLQQGTPMEEVIADYKAAAVAGDISKKIIWSGTGVGLIKKAVPAADIVKTTQAEARRIIARVKL